MVLIRLLSLENSHNKEKEKIPVSELLLQRLNVLKGCLTAKSMGQLVEQLTNLPKVLA